MFGGAGSRWCDGVAQASQKRVVFHDEKEDLCHATGVDDDEERRPSEDLVGAEMSGCEGLDCDGDGEDGGE